MPTHHAVPAPDCSNCRPDQVCLFHAILEDDVAQVRTLLANEPEVLDGDWDFLELAVGEGHLAIAELLLLTQSADVREVLADKTNDGLLSSAVFGGHVDAVRWLLAQGAHVDGPPNGSPSLMMAAKHGHLEITQILLEAGAEINREALREPATALDYAVLYDGTGNGGGEHTAVAELLRECGGIQPYNLRWNWEGARGQAHVEHIQDALWSVHPNGVERELAPGRTVEIHKSRFSPRSWRYQLLFTVDVAEVAGVEIALCLPSEWPLNRASLEEQEYNWPYELLFSLATWLVEGGTLAHGDVMDAEHPGLAGIAWQQGIFQWLVARHESIESQRPDGVAETLILLPVTMKKRIQPGPDALARADKAAAAKWGRPHVVPLGYRASWLMGPAPIFAKHLPPLPDRYGS